jgi:citrate lyase beta subunit
MLQSTLSHEAHVRELQQQVLLLSEEEAVKSNEQHARLAALVAAFNKLREGSEGQVTFSEKKCGVGLEHLDVVT